jgi:DNA-binding beta-propeller fold protein YncE
VANRGDGTLSRVSEKTGRPQRAVDVGGAPTALAATSEAMLVLDSATADVLRLDPRTDRVTDRVHLGGYPAALAVGDRGALWSVDARSGTVTRVSSAG